MKNDKILSFSYGLEQIVNEQFPGQFKLEGNTIYKSRSWDETI